MESNTNITGEILLNKLRAGEHFTFLRFGNGEFDTIYQDNPMGRNKNGCRHFKDLGKVLLKIISQPKPYYIGIQPLAMRQRPGIEKKFAQEWINADILHRMSIDLKFKPFITEFLKRKSMIVGNWTLRRLGCPVITIPQRNSWLQYEKIKTQVLRESENYDVIGVCGGLAGKVLINDLFEKYRFTKTVIDFGSVLDPYVGIQSRKYHKDLIKKI